MPFALAVPATIGLWEVLGGAAFFGSAIGAGVLVGHAISHHNDEVAPTPAQQQAEAKEGAKEDLSTGHAVGGCDHCDPDDDPSKKKANKKRWSKGKASSPEENAEAHWEKHKGEFPEYKNADDYVNGAYDFVDNPPEGTLSKPASQGGKMLYEPRTNTFSSVDAAGNPRTMFRPVDGQSYWNKL